MARKSSAERASMLAGGFAKAKKNIVIQYQGRDRSEDNILAMVKKDAISKGAKDDEIEHVDIYIKPEEGAIYYVVNSELSGSIVF